MKMEGRLVVLLATMPAFLWQGIGGMELAPLSFIPQELISYFRPESRHESDVYPGLVARHRRDVIDKKDADEAQLKVYKTIQDSAGNVHELCMMATTDVEFVLNFETKPAGVKSRKYRMPREPDVVNGSCALDTETARMHIYWPGFNFTLVFTKNPEGNSYYLNKAVVIYDRSSPSLKKDFIGAKKGGKVYLETLSGSNYYFVALGKSYFCTKAEDQGPLDLYNRDMNQIEGSLAFSNTRFQPFVKRAGGSWGEKVKCLPKAIRLLREDVVPFVSITLVLATSGAMIGMYAIKRTYFSTKKVDYNFYGEEAREGHHEMGGVVTSEPQQVAMPQEDLATGPPAEVPQTQETVVKEPKEPPTANPFRQQEASNPFRSGYGAT